MWILWSSYPVPTIVKSCSECSKTPLFVENVEVVPGTANNVPSNTLWESIKPEGSGKGYVCVIFTVKVKVFFLSCKTILSRTIYVYYSFWIGPFYVG